MTKQKWILIMRRVVHEQRLVVYTFKTSVCSVGISNTYSLTYDSGTNHPMDCSNLNYVECKQVYTSYHIMKALFLTN